MIETIKKDVYEKLKYHPKRWRHVQGVYETALKLAKVHQVDPYLAGIAAIYHDYAKYDTITDQIKGLSDEVIQRYAQTPVMYHALSAAHQLEAKHYIADENILNAIRYHVFGHKEMTKLQQIIFISDYCEPHRTFTDITYIFDLAVKDLDLATLYCMQLTRDEVLSKQQTIHPEQEEAYQYYKEINHGKTQ